MTYTVDSFPTLGDWIRPDDLVAMYPDMLTRNSVRIDIREKEVNGLMGAGGCMIFKHRAWLHKTKYPAWVAERYAGAA